MFPVCPWESFQLFNKAELFAIPYSRKRITIILTATVSQSLLPDWFDNYYCQSGTLQIIFCLPAGVYRITAGSGYRSFPTLAGKQ
jgi:hypothetical protein